MPRVPEVVPLHLHSPTMFALSARSHNCPTDLSAWHRRLGHVGMDAIKTLMSKKLVDGLIVTSQKVAGMCEDCIFGKQTRRPFDEVVTPEMEINERVHTFR
jgi:hypothetical protein